MAKVRYTQRCKGPCGLMLRHGTIATRFHLGYLCHDCLSWVRDRQRTSERTETGDQRLKSAL